MKYLILVTFLVFAQPVAAEQVYNYFELGVYHIFDDDGSWEGDTPTRIALGRHWDVQKNFYIEAEVAHYSNIDRGGPFNNLPESWMDTVGVTLGFRF